MANRFKGILYEYPESEDDYEFNLATDITELLEYMNRNANTMSISELSAHIVCMCDMVADLQVMCANNCDAAVAWKKTEYKKFYDMLMDTRVCLA